MSIVIDGKGIADKIKGQLKQKVTAMWQKLGVRPGLAAVLVGENPASKVYVASKQKACEKIGVYSELHHLSAKTTKEQLIALVASLNKNSKIHGILIQLPLPKPIDENVVLKTILPEKDIDGLTPINQGNLLLGNPGYIPCTPKGIIKLIESTGHGISGKNAVVMGRSKLVGNPVAILLQQANATVTVCHSHTKNLEYYTRNADILVVAIGRPKFVTADMVKEDAIVIDVGINREGESIHGDVDFDAVKEKTSFITPVPGGVGPMTIAMLLENTVMAAELANKINL